MDLVDWIILAVLAVAIFGGMAQGLFRATCSLAGLVLGTVLAGWNYAWLAMVVLPVVHFEAVADTIGFLVIAAAVMFVANLIGVILRKTFRGMGLGCIDVTGGALVGFVQGALLVTIAILVTVAFFPGTAWLTQARLPRAFFGACHLSTHLSPEELSGRVLEGLKSLKQESPKWLHEKTGGS